MRVPAQSDVAHGDHVGECQEWRVGQFGRRLRNGDRRFRHDIAGAAPVRIRSWAVYYDVVSGVRPNYSLSGHGYVAGEEISHMTSRTRFRFWLGTLVLSFGAVSGTQTVLADGLYDVTIDGSDAIFIAGRTDLLPIPPLDGNAFAFVLRRHGYITPEAIVETLPPFVPVAGGDVVRLADPAVGGISFYNGFAPPAFGPSGNGLGGSNLSALDGISGYIGPQGPLAGVFLDNSIPDTGPAPATLDFSAGGIGIDFASISPLLRQVFYIGDGVAGGSFQEFIAPAGATRLFLAIPDGFGFVGVPGAYDDNDGAYRVTIGVNRIPVVPLPAAAWLGLGLLGGLGVVRRLRGGTRNAA